MESARTPATRGRSLLDGGYVLLLLTLTIVAGWGFLIPTDLLATTLARSAAPLTPPAVVAESPAPIVPAPRPQSYNFV